MPANVIPGLLSCNLLCVVNFIIVIIVIVIIIIIIILINAH